MSKPATDIPEASLLPSGGFAGATGLDPELLRALDERVVVRGFTCCVCDENFTEAAPCLEHLRSDGHKRAQTRTQQPIPDLADGSWVFPWPVVTGTEYVPPSDKVYRDLSTPRGLVLIFNYCFPGHGQLERLGAKRDSFNLKTLFCRMGYIVTLHEDKSKSQTEQALASTQNDPCLSNYDCLIVFILSHGKDDQIFYTASGREEDCMRLDDVRYRFTDTECPALKGKPKLFFVNFSRTRHSSYDSISLQHSEPRDMMTLYSCISNFHSPRDPELGSFFVQGWCEVLAAHAHDEDLYDLHFRVSQLMRKMNGSVPELQGYGFRKFYFNPVHEQ